jgi:hypothetical protein
MKSGGGKNIDLWTIGRNKDRNARSESDNDFSSSCVIYSAENEARFILDRRFSVFTISLVHEYAKIFSPLFRLNWEDSRNESFEVPLSSHAIAAQANDSEIYSIGIWGASARMLRGSENIRQTRVWSETGWSNATIDSAYSESTNLFDVPITWSVPSCLGDISRRVSSQCLGMVDTYPYKLVMNSSTRLPGRRGRHSRNWWRRKWWEGIRIKIIYSVIAHGYRAIFTWDCRKVLRTFNSNRSTSILSNTDSESHLADY